MVQMKADEWALWENIYKALDTPRAQRESFVGIAERLGMHHKRLEYVLYKPRYSRWWDCGVSHRYGWLTAEGIRAIRELLQGPV